MFRTLLACLLAALPAWADSPIPDGKKEGGQSPDDPVVQLKRELDELKKQQAALARQIEDTAAKLKKAEERVSGSIKVTVSGILRKGQSSYHVRVLESDRSERRVFLHPTRAQEKTLDGLEGKLVAVTGDLVLNATDPDGQFTQPARFPRAGGEIAVRNFTVTVLPAAEPRGKGGEK